MRKNTILILILVAIVFAGGIYFFMNMDNQRNSDIDVPGEDIVAETEEQDQEPAEEQSDEEEKEVEEFPAPDFTLQNLSGKDVSLSDYKGKYVLINFWATWCVWCDKEMPDLDRLHKEYDDLVVLAVNFMEDKETVEKYIQEGGYEFEVVLDTDGRINMEYYVGAYPTSYFVDKEGILLGRVEGMLAYEQMVEIVESIREER